MEPVFLGDFANQEDVESNFNYTLIGGEKILLAHYDNGGYDGDAFVLFEDKGNLFEVNGGHCSCNGLEGLWEPEAVTVKALRKRMLEGHFDLGGDIGQLTTVLDKWETDNDRSVH